MIFDAVRTVLGDLDAAGAEQYGGDWDGELAEQLAGLEASYRQLRNPNRDLIDYSRLSAQTAYLFRYVIGHAEFIAEILSRVRAEVGEPLFEAGELNIGSLGGGPGSELLGLLKYLSSPGSGEGITNIKCTIFDKESDWQHVAEALAEAVDTEIGIELSFETLDVCDGAVCGALDLGEFDLVFMSFFISEICELPQKANVVANMKNVLSTISRGAYLLYNDSNAYSFYMFMNGRARAAGRFNQLVEVESQLEVHHPDLEGIYQDFIEKFDYRPKLSGNLVSKFYRRV